MKKILSVISAIVLLLPFISVPKTTAFNFSLTSQIMSESAILINLDSNIIVHEKNANIKQMPSALVNIMTAIICIENKNNLKEEIVVNENVYSQLYYIEKYEDLRYADLYDGDVLSYEDLLYAMMLVSSFEAAQLIAYHIGESDVANFVNMMNAKASELGCTNTNFTNPTGLYDDNQYTTAADMAIITQYALSLPQFPTIANTLSYRPTVPNFESHPSGWIWKHSNLMMDPDSEYYYSGVKGIKTGNLESVGRNLITTASKNGNNYLLILLNSPVYDENGDGQFYHLEDAAYIFDWAFNHLSYQVLLSANNEIDEIEVSLGQDAEYVLIKPAQEFSYLWYDGIDTALIKQEITRPSVVTAPITKGQKLGTVELKYSGETIGSVDLVAVSNIDRSVAKYNMYTAKKFFVSDWLKKAFIISIVLSVIYIIICIYAYIRYKSNAKPIKPIYSMPKIPNEKRKNKKDKD